MSRRNVEPLGRRAFLAGGLLSLGAAGLDPLPTAVVAADPPPDRKADPPLDPKRAVVEKLAALKPNHGVLLGKADAVGEFNATARKYGLDKTGPRARDFTLKVCWAPDR